MSVPSVAGPPAGRARAPPSPGAPGSARGLPAGARSARPPPAARGRFAARPAAPRDPGTFSAGSWLPSSPSFCVSSNFLPDKPGLTLCSPSSPVPSVFHSLSLGLSLPSPGTFSPFSVYVLLRLRDACCFCYRHWGPRAPQDRNGEEPGEIFRRISSGCARRTERAQRTGRAGAVRGSAALTRGATGGGLSRGGSGGFRCLVTAFPPAPQGTRGAGPSPPRGRSWSGPASQGPGGY